MRVAYPRSNRYTSPLIELVLVEGIEPATSSLPKRCTTTVLYKQ